MFEKIKVRKHDNNVLWCVTYQERCISFHKTWNDAYKYALAYSKFFNSNV